MVAGLSSLALKMSYPVDAISKRIEHIAGTHDYDFSRIGPHQIAVNKNKSWKVAAELARFSDNSGSALLINIILLTAYMTKNS